jgi:dipeptidyl aminopeptidase/acylaminoacyl peptidase
MLASRGYAVLQPQFRGSTGFGRAFEKAGYGQWGLAMQDDISAGAQWLVDQGIAAGDRLCIYGTHYGGYAAMWALARTPALFRCGISRSGISDLNFRFDDDPMVIEHPAARITRKTLVGDPDQHRQDLDAVSPVLHAAAIQAAVLIAHGDEDHRVPIAHSENLVRALKANHKPVEWIKLVDHGHVLTHPAGELRFYTALFDFLDRQIGPSALKAAAATAKP